MSLQMIFDGGMGTMLQDFPRDENDSRWECNEYWNLKRPADIQAIHRAFLEAGSTVIETNTFGANPIILSEYGLEGDTESINREAVRIAKAAVADFPGTRVAASIGPGSKLPSLGHISVEESFAAYFRQINALFEVRPDFLLIETSQDLLQIKIILSVIQECEQKWGFEIPVMVSVTVEENGAMLVGSSIEAVIATLAPFKLFSLGINCATGPDKMESTLKILSQESPFPISCMPNQGIPQIQGGRACYSLQPEEFGEKMVDLIKTYNISIVGGCCGTRPGHIAALTSALKREGLWQ